MVRIVVGELAEDALAAVAFVLVALAAARREPPPAARTPVPGWRRLSWSNPYRSPASWR